MLLLLLKRSVDCDKIVENCCEKVHDLRFDLYRNMTERIKIIMFDVEMTKHLAELSKLTFTEEELKKVTAEMTDIIALMDRVKEIDPALETYALPAVRYDELRRDTARESLDTDKIVKNAKAVKDNAFAVPKVV